MEIRRVIVVFFSDPRECDLRAGGSRPNATTESSADDRQHSFGQNTNGHVEDEGENPHSFQVSFSRILEAYPDCLSPGFLFGHFSCTIES